MYINVLKKRITGKQSLLIFLSTIESKTCFVSLKSTTISLHLSALSWNLWLSDQDWTSSAAHWAWLQDPLGTTYFTYRPRISKSSHQILWDCWSWVKRAKVQVWFPEVRPLVRHPIHKNSPLIASHVAVYSLRSRTPNKQFHAEWLACRSFAPKEYDFPFCNQIVLISQQLPTRQ